MTARDQIGNPNQMGPEQPVSPGRPQPYQFSKEEMQVLKECNRDAFFQRSLPLGTIMGVGVYYGVQSGHMKPNPRWGATPKIFVASILGYFIGKISYQWKCAERIMQLPDSKLGAMLRQRKRGAGFKESLEPGYGPSMSLMPFSGTNPSDTYSDVGVGDIDTTRPDYRGLDDSQRPSMDNPIFDEEETMPPVQDKTTSYEELRTKNREEYKQYKTGNYREISPTPPPKVRRPSIFDDPSAKTNVYGDRID